MGKAAAEVKVFRKGDIFIIAAALLAAAIGFILALSRPTGGYAEITLDGEVVARLPLSEDGSYELSGNLVVVEGGEARMEWADCPDGICVGHAPIGREGESIVCLPNRVAVEIVGGGRPKVDAISG